MVRALFIDDSLEAPLPLVVVIRDIGNEVGIATLAFAHDPVLVVTKVSGAQPECVLLLEGVAGLLKRADGLLDCATVV